MSILSRLGKTTPNAHSPETAVHATAAIEHASGKFPNSGVGRLVKPLIIAGTLAMATFGTASQGVARETSDVIDSAGRIYRVFGNDRTTKKILNEAEYQVRKQERYERKVEAERERAERAAMREQERAIKAAEREAKAAERAAARAPADEIRARKQRIRETEQLQKIEARERELGIR